MILKVVLKRLSCYLYIKLSTFLPVPLYLGGKTQTQSACTFNKSSLRHCRRGVLDTTLCDKVCQWHATGWWFSPGTPVSSTNKTDRHDLTGLLLKVALNTISLTCTKDMTCASEIRFTICHMTNRIHLYYYWTIEHTLSKQINKFYNWIIYSVKKVEFLEINYKAHNSKVND